MTHDLTCILTVCDDGLTVHFSGYFWYDQYKKTKAAAPTRLNTETAFFLLRSGTWNYRHIQEIAADQGRFLYVPGPIRLHPSDMFGIQEWRRKRKLNFITGAASCQPGQACDHKDSKGAVYKTKKCAFVWLLSETDYKIGLIAVQVRTFL